MDLVVPESQKNQINELDKSVRERIIKKLDEIDNKISDLGLDPNKVIEKRLKGKFSQYLQQRVGGYRLWFKVIEEDDNLLLVNVLHKEEAQKRY